jgi:hypothetical protein
VGQRDHLERVRVPQMLLREKALEGRSPWHGAVVQPAVVSPAQHGCRLDKDVIDSDLKRWTGQSERERGKCVCVCTHASVLEWRCLSV